MADETGISPQGHGDTEKNGNERTPKGVAGKRYLISKKAWERFITTSKREKNPSRPRRPIPVCSRLSQKPAYSSKTMGFFAVPNGRLDAFEMQFEELLMFQ